jgi:hypothetical protein
MRRQTTWIALVILLGTGHSATPAQGEDTLIRAAVRRVLAPRMFTIEYQPGVDGELIVLAHNVEATPVPGSVVLVGGVLRTLGEAELKGTPGFDEIETGTRETLASRPVLVATSLRTATGGRLLGDAAAGRPSRQPLLEESRGRSGAPRETTLHPGTFARLIDVMGGQLVRLPRARVLVVINPRVLLVESASPLAATTGNLDRVLVLVDEGALRVDAAAIVGSDVTVLGTARTLLGMQVTGEVPWPPILTRDVTERYEIRAAVLATSVQTADGVELTNRK